MLDLPLQKATQVSTVMLDVLGPENTKDRGLLVSWKHPAYWKGVKSVQEGASGPWLRLLMG